MITLLLLIISAVIGDEARTKYDKRHARRIAEARRRYNRRKEYYRRRRYEEDGLLLY